MVRDEQGRPIAGALVFATTYPAAIVWPEIAADPNGALAIATTDERGRWRSETLPVGTAPEAAVRVILRHSDHVAAECPTTAATARAFASVQVLQAGRSLSGRVLSPFDRPVRGATVLVATPPWDDGIIRLTTDAAGRFSSDRSLDPRWSKVVMSVQSPGLAFDVRDVEFTPEIIPQVVRLTRRRPIEGRVIDVRGRPIAGAVVSANRRYFKNLVEWETTTGPDGRFVWHDAPTEGFLLIDASLRGFSPLNVSVVRPGADDLTISLNPE